MDKKNETAETQAEPGRIVDGEILYNCCMMFTLSVLLLIFLCCESNDRTFRPKYTGRQRFYVEFKNGIVHHNYGVKSEQYANTIAMISEAHEKFKFMNGTIYFDNGDNRHKEVAKKTYYAAHDIKYDTAYQKITGPDFSCLAWRTAQIPSFMAETRKIVEASKVAPQNYRIGWIGNVHSPLESVPESYTRPLLLQYAKNYSDYFDFRHFPPSLFLRNHPSYKSIPNLTRDFAYLLDIGGIGYSARLKYLLYSGRPIFYVERSFVEYFSADLLPHVHFIPVKHDLSDLVQQYEWAVQHPESTAKIAESARQYAKTHLVHDQFIEKVGEVVAYLLLDGN